MMLTFIFALIIRLLSGCKNAAYYASKDKMSIGIALLLVITIMIWSINFPLIISGLCIIPCIFIFALCISFILHKHKNIHLFEYGITTTWTIIAFLSGGGIFALFVSGIFGNVLFNIPIQYVSTGNLFNKVSATDDKTGKTTGVWLFDKKYKIPRLPNGFTKLYIGLGLVTIYLINYFTINWDLTLKQIINVFN